MPTHRAAGPLILALLPRTPSIVVHRVVHGGRYTGARRITSAVLEELHTLTPLAPLHQPKSLELIAFFGAHVPVQVACFDTAFHRTMPAVARTYALPKELTARHHVERYGFHGLAHEALAREAAGTLKRPFRKCTMITCQLGNGVSMCAIKDGKSVDTTMGYTPLEGLVMGTRSGSIDPAIPLLFVEQGMPVARVHAMLEHESGLKGLTGTNDVRDLLVRKDAAARLALDLFAYHVRKQLGAYIAVLGRVDAIVLGGGIAQSPIMRGKILAGLETLDIHPDPVALKKQIPARLSVRGIPVFALHGDEQTLMHALARTAR